MKKNIIKDKTFKFAVRIVNFAKFLQDKKEFVLSKQILRSGTSIGALIRESEHAESKADFIHKFAIAQKEANETEYWLELLFETKFVDNTVYESLKSDVIEIQKIIASIIISSRKNL
jgi:four helix bundle protein